MLDADLADLYGTTVGRLNHAVDRNPKRFPADFMFKLTDAEARALGVRARTRVFTEVGAVMLSSVLRTRCAARVGIFVIRSLLGSSSGRLP